MSERQELQLSFKAPEDVKLPEVAVLTKTISNLFEKLERISSKERIAKTTDGEIDKLEGRLVIKEVQYGSDLILILLTASLVALSIPGFIVASRQLKDQETQRVALKKQEDAEATERSFRRLLREREGDELRRAISKLADELHVSMEELLELVSPELV